MRKYFIIFLSFLFTAVLPFNVFCAPLPEGLRVSASEVDKPKTGQLATECNPGQNVNEPCDKIKAAAIQECRKQKATKNSEEKLICTAIVCKTNFVLHNGICKSEDEANQYCIRRQKNACKAAGEKPWANIIKHTGTSFDKKIKKEGLKVASTKDRAEGECVCIDKNAIKYDCGGGEGTPPTNNGSFTNLESIVVAENTCTKKDSKFLHWECGGKITNPGDTLTNMTEQITCTAQWEPCAPCAPGDGCNCEIKVVNNECTYVTSPKQGYDIVSNPNTANPVCRLQNETICTNKGGYFINGKCECSNPAIPGTYFDTETSKCVCKEAGATLVGNVCKKCPAGSSGEYPQCNCGDGKEFKNDKCEDLCNTAIADWNGTECKCKESGKTYTARSPINQSTCDCPSDKPEYKDNKCVKADGAACNATGKSKYDSATGKCLCDPNVNGAIFVVGESQCKCEDASLSIVDIDGAKQCAKLCPDNKTPVKQGVDCPCGDDKEYDREHNKCNVKATLCPDGKTPVKEGVDCPCDGDKKYDRESNTCKEKAPDCPQGATGTHPNCVCGDGDKYNKEKNICEEDKEKKAEEAKKAYEDAKAKEQSTENKMLGGLTMAATGLGAMELMQGLSEQKADKAAEADMSAYIETMRCTYAEGKQVKAGPEEIELPGGNDATLMKLRTEYLALAKDLKERKEALGMKPGIEAEEILDKANIGLYDDENVGITGGHYGSLYRAQMLGSEKDQAKIDEAKSASSKRVKGGAIALAGGAAMGILGNSLINGKLGELIKKSKDGKTGKNVEAETKKDEAALKEIQNCLKTAGAKNPEKVTVDNIMPSLISVKNIKCKDLTKVKAQEATTVLSGFDINNVEPFLNNLITYFGGPNTGLMLGITISEKPTDDEKAAAKEALEKAIEATKKRYEDAAAKDEAANK